ncbi:glycosyltransferase family 4 protein [Bradyrhizobium sp. GCM10028915]|uniref:glycosyltransferase family 4 protein n=1 Tax=Bradyrhizobium sp. GCM10028915 TaxID=3273385 RepID=UPI00360D66CA
MINGMKPKLLVVCHLPPPFHGAAVMGSAVAGSKLIAECFEISVVPIQMTKKLDDLRKFGFFKILRSLKLWYEVFSRTRKLKPKAIYLTAGISGFSLWRDLIIACTCKMMGSRLILHLHTKGVKINFNRSFRYRLAYRWLFSNSDVIHLSQVFYDDVACAVAPVRFYPVPNGVNVGESRAIDSVGSLHRERIPTILFFSNLLEEKGPLDLLEASNRLAKKGARHKIVFAGAPSDEKVLVALTEAQRVNGERVILLGPQYGSAKDLVFADCDIFAFPSYYHFEAQPLVVMEAMGHGLAIVASSEGAIPELLEDGAGLICAPRDISQLTAHLERLIEDKSLRTKLGQVARHRYLQRYTLGAFEERFASTLREIMSRTSLFR